MKAMGPYRTFRTVYSAAPAVTKKDTISCAVELRLRMRTFKCGGVLLQCGSGWGMGELVNGRSWGMGGAEAEEWVELGDGWSSGGFLFFTPMVYFLRYNSILLGAAIMVKKIFASYLTVASRAY